MPADGHVFISYARADGREYAERLYNDLTARGIPAWRDERNLNPDQDFTAELEKAIEAASRVVVCITPDVKRDNSFVRREIGYAIRSKKPIVPLLFADLVPPISIVNITDIDFHRQAWLAALDQLIYRLEQPPSAHEKPNRPDDPFRDYLDTLYKAIVDYLDATVFTLIPLHSQGTPEAVEKQVPALLVSFFGTALPIKGLPQETDDRFDNFADAFDRYNRRVLLLGNPGAGKTTTLMAFARDAVAKRLENPTHPLPILARITDWDAEKVPSIVEWLSSSFSSNLRQMFSQEIVDGRTLLMLDGLDELGGEREDQKTKLRYDPRRKFISLIPQNNGVLITCRVKDYQGIGEKIALEGATTLQELDDAQIAEYLDTQPELLEAVRGDRALREMTRTPLLLSLFRFAYAEMGEQTHELRDLRHSPGELRDKIFSTYILRRYEHEQRKPHVYLPYDVNTIYKVLSAIAFDDVGYWWRGDNRVTNGQIKKIINDDPAPFINQMIQLHIFVSSDEGDYRFIHLLLRDFFAFSNCINMLHSRSSEIRVRAAYGLGRIGDVRASEPLMRVLQDDHSAVRIATAKALSQVADTRTLDWLFIALFDTNREVSQTAADALVRIGNKLVLNRLFSALYDPRRDISKVASETLIRIGSEEVRRRLLKLVKFSEPWTVLIISITALGLLREERAIPLLIELLDYESGELQKAISEALVEIGKPSIMYLIDVIKHGERVSLLNAINILGHMRYPEAIDVLVGMLGHRNFDIQLGVSLALIKIGEPAVPSLVTILQSGNKKLKALAADTLQRMNSYQARDALKKYWRQ